MKSQEQIRAEIDRALDDLRLEEAEALIEQLVPITPEEFRRRLDEAPYDDEPVTQKQRESIARVRSMLSDMKASGTSRQAG